MLIGRSFSHYTLYLLQCKWITGTFYSSDNDALILETLFRAQARSLLQVHLKMFKLYVVQVFPCESQHCCYSRR